MTANQIKCSRLEQISVIKVFMAKKCKQCKNYGRMDDVYEKNVLVKRCLQMS